MQRKRKKVRQEIRLESVHFLQKLSLLLQPFNTKTELQFPIFYKYMLDSNGFNCA